MAATAYSPNQQTKQQLEELDALLQRMLALPVNANDPGPASAPLPTNPELFAPSPPTLPLPPRPVAGSESIVQAWRVQSPNVPEAMVLPFAPPQPPIATAVESPPPEPRFFTSPASSPTTAAAPAPFPYQMVFGPQTSSPSSMVAAPTTTGIPAPQWEAGRSSAGAAPLPVTLWPILALNKVFDLFTLPLGPFGSWLRQSSGRNTLGWIGVLLILGAIGWGVADWYGLDWTR